MRGISAPLRSPRDDNLQLGGCGAVMRHALAPQTPLRDFATGPLAGPVTRDLRLGDTHGVRPCIPPGQRPSCTADFGTHWDSPHRPMLTRVVLAGKRKRPDATHELAG